MPPTVRKGKPFIEGLRGFCVARWSRQPSVTLRTLTQIDVGHLKAQKAQEDLSGAFCAFLWLKRSLRRGEKPLAEFLRESEVNFVDDAIMEEHSFWLDRTHRGTPRE